MPSIPQNSKNKNEILDFSAKFMKEFQIGRLLFQCNAGKMKGIPVMGKIQYGHQGGHFNIKEIYSRNRKRRGVRNTFFPSM